MKILMALFLMLAIGSPAAACFKGVCMGDKLKPTRTWPEAGFESETRALENDSFDILIIEGTPKGGACAVSAIEATDEDGSMHHYWGLSGRLREMHGNPDPELPIFPGVRGGLAQQRWTLKSNPDGIKSIYIYASYFTPYAHLHSLYAYMVTIKYTFKNYDDCEMAQAKGLGKWEKLKKGMEDIEKKYRLGQ